MNPLILAGLFGAGGLGGILGGQGRPAFDPAMLARLFGPNALAGDTQTLYNTLAASPMFSQMLSSASSMGTRAGNASQAAFARAGLSDSGVGAVNSAVSSGFGQNLMLNARANLWQQALQQASQNLQGRMGLWGQSALMKQGTPTMAQQFGSALTGGAGMGLNAYLQSNPGHPAPTQNWGSLGAGSSYGGPLGLGNSGPWGGSMGTGSFLPSARFSPYPGTSVVTAPMRRYPWGN